MTRAPEGGDEDDPSTSRPNTSIALVEAAPGAKPLLSWAAVEGATQYRLVVLDLDGKPHWAWSGTDTAVHVGGNETGPTVGMPDVRIVSDMIWQVSAYDDAGVPIAFSGTGRLSP